jgi:hypothetical protein
MAAFHKSRSTNGNCPAVSRLFSDLGLEIPSDEQRTPEGVRAFHKNDIEKWWPIIKAANIKAE